MRLNPFSPSMYREFRTMGDGIEQRYARCAQWWEPHLKCCRAFIREHLRTCKRVGILGAGRLLDVDVSHLLQVAEESHLFDADRGCLSVWKKKSRSEGAGLLVPRIVDVTDCLSQWSTGLKNLPRSRPVEEYLLGLTAPVPRWSHEEFDAIVSLNIAGQIPLYWRDFVRKTRIDLSDRDEEALAVSMGELQRAHLEGLMQCTAKRVIALFDTDYYFYEASQTGWRVEPAWFIESFKSFCTPSPDRQLVACDTWLWHLAPQFVESQDEGEIHRVEARVWDSPCENYG